MNSSISASEAHLGVNELDALFELGGVIHH